MRRAIGPNGMRRVERDCARNEVKLESARTAATSRAKTSSTPPSLLDSRWLGIPPSEWHAHDVVACYASAYVSAYGSEDPEIKTRAGRDRAGHILRRLLSELGAGESAREFVEWAVREIRRGRSWPRDGAASPGVLVYNWILLKRWRVRRRGKQGVAVRGADFEEG